MAFACQCALLCETIQRLAHKGRRPFAIINFVGLPFRRSRDLRLCLVIQLLWNYPPPAFQRVFAIASICDEMFQRSEQKSTELPFLWIGARITAFLDQVGEKALRQVLRILASVSFIAQENVERAPIGLAQFRERTECLSGSRRVARFKDHCPTGRDKQFVATVRFPTGRKRRCFHRKVT